jgi:hypothetical protein
VRSGFIWVGHNECLKLHQRGWFALIGDAFLLKKQPPGEDFKCNRLPKLSGFNKDKISSKHAVILETILSEDDVYVYDNFRDSLIVSKAPSALDTILEQIVRIKT